ncbi:unnamed protein product [Lupinus luteus]|uniref:Uncharacterized protein n=1 Tax=Lupinus luteus TaxID=3873 RepID=A0AAV1YMF3_LUPLU
MNGTTSIDIVQENGNGSDSDTNSDESQEYYQPISAVDDGDGNSDGEDGVELNQLSNGYCVHDGVENGILHLDLNGNVEQKSDDEEERTRDASIRRAFREDENRRSAPLTAENATRVMEAMRGVSFCGMAPDWVAEFPEDRWIDQLHRLRQSPNN